MPKIMIVLMSTLEMGDLCHVVVGISMVLHPEKFMCKGVLVI